MDAATFDYRILATIFLVVIPVSVWFVLVGRRRLKAVSYTHLTLPTIYSV